MDTAEDVVKLILAGADAAMTTAALLRHGPGHIETLVAGLETWLDERRYSSVARAKGSLLGQQGRRAGGLPARQLLPDAALVGPGPLTPHWLGVPVDGARINHPDRWGHLRSFSCSGFTSVSAALGRRLVAAPLAFVAIGAVLGLAVGPLAGSATDSVELVAEITLVLILFHDAAQVRPREIGADRGLNARLLLVASR